MMHRKAKVVQMKRATRLIAAFAAASVVLMPGLALARAGNGSSMGSRGSMTYSAPPTTNTAPYSAGPLQRSMTQPQQNYGSRGYGSPGYNQPARSGFMPGLVGGLIGAGIGGLLLGHGFFGGGLGFGGFIGFLLQIFLLVMVVRLAFRWFGNRQRPAMAGGPNIFARGGNPAPGGFGGNTMGGGGGNPAPPPVAITPADYQQFEQLLSGVQAAWSAHDLNGLQAMTTPEMASYFAEQLSEQVSRGVRNTVTDVRLVSGDLAQSWSERGVDYATVAMRFSMVDVTRDGSGRVVDGSPTEHLTATELWTFVRSSGGRWILSAIQQAR
jgi:predicted lipid-binding transport protein (Tim44 family)